MCVRSSSLNKSVSFYYHEVLFSFYLEFSVLIFCVEQCLRSTLRWLMFTSLFLAFSLSLSLTRHFFFFSLSQFYTENEIKTIPYPFIYCYKIEFTKWWSHFIYGIVPSSSSALWAPHTHTHTPPYSLSHPLSVLSQQHVHNNINRMSCKTYHCVSTFPCS